MTSVASIHARRLALALTALCAIHSRLLAQVGPPSASSSDNVPQAVGSEGANLDGYYAIPEIPATSILAGTPQTITRPVTPKDFASALISGVDQDGKVRQGLALEVSVGLFHLLQTSLSEYQASWYNRVRSNTLFSLATVRSSGDTTSSDVGWGVYMPLFDGGDPLANPKYTSQLGSAMLRCAPTTPLAVKPNTAGMNPEQIADAMRKYEAARAAGDTAGDPTRAELQLSCLENVAQKLGKQAAKETWNAARLFLAYAGSVRLAQSSVTDRQRLADRFWLTGGWPLYPSVQVIGYLDYTHHRAVENVGAFSSAQYGGRVNVGSATFNGFYELLGQSAGDAGSLPRKRSSSWSAGVEFLATEGMWISTGFGKRADDLLKPDRTAIIANIRWGFASKSFLSPIPSQ